MLYTCVSLERSSRPDRCHCQVSPGPGRHQPATGPSTGPGTGRDADADGDTPPNPDVGPGACWAGPPQNHGPDRCAPSCPVDGGLAVNRTATNPAPPMNSD